MSNAETNIEPLNTPLDVAIIGAGFSGIGAAIRLKQKGIANIAILEKTDRAGGTWRDNQYPGAACDIPSELYSFSFAPNPNWSRLYSGAQEIVSYIDGLIASHDLASMIRYNHEVCKMQFDEQANRWHLQMADGREIVAQHVIVASGPFSAGAVPNFEGLEQFQGHKTHSAAWDHDYDFSGKSVAVIGTGASAVQIVPELVKSAKRVLVFQRTSGWVLPKPNPMAQSWVPKSKNAQKLLRSALFWGHEAAATGVVWNSPLTKILQRASKAYLKQTVSDPWLRRQLTPDYRIGCKRVLMSSDYYPALMADNCRLITWPIVRFAEGGVVTAAGLEYSADCVVFATGFEVGQHSLPYDVIGLGGRSLADDWKGGAKAYKSVSIAGYPNLFLTFGPNSGPGHNSALVYVEAQINYITQAITKMRKKNIARVDVKQARQDSYNKDIQARLAKTNWASGCDSWYLTDDGFNATMFPGFATQYQKQMSHIALADYHCMRNDARAKPLSKRTAA